MPQIDHRRLIEEILTDVSSVAADPIFLSEEAALVVNLEQNRISITDILRCLPQFVEKVKATKAKRMESEVFAILEGSYGSFSIYTADFLEFPSEEARRELAILLTDRGCMFGSAIWNQEVRILLMTNGDERVLPWWAAHPLSPRETYLPSRWMEPTSKNGFPHYQAGFLLLAGTLMERWMDEELLPEMEVGVGQHTHRHPLLPHKALMLDAVDRLPPVFYSPAKLRAQLERITSVAHKDS